MRASVVRTGLNGRVDDVGVSSHAKSLAFLLPHVNRTSSERLSNGSRMNQDTPGARLRSLRTARGLSAVELAERVGRSESAVRNQENGTNGIPPKLAALYAQALGSSAAFILYGTGEGARPPSASFEGLPVRRRVQAGAWLAVDDLSQVEPRRYPAAPDPRFPHAQQWLSEVIGDSMNALEPSPIVEGDLVHCIEAIEAGYAPRTGDIVEAERSRFGGQEVEVSLKQVVVRPSGVVELWPRSKNPRWSEPLIPTDGASEEEVEVRICAFVVALVRTLPGGFRSQPPAYRPLRAGAPQGRWLLSALLRAGDRGSTFRTPPWLGRSHSSLPPAPLPLIRPVHRAPDRVDGRGCNSHACRELIAHRPRTAFSGVRPSCV